MTSKQLKDLARLLGICSIFTVLGGCQKQDGKDTTPVENPIVIETSSVQNNSTKSDTISTEKVTQQKLVINPGCVGCGHCTMFSPKNFAMNGRQAYVVSQEDINSQAVQQAIMRCKAGVIEIVEA